MPFYLQLHITKTKFHKENSLIGIYYKNSFSNIVIWRSASAIETAWIIYLWINLSYCWGEIFQNIHRPVKDINLSAYPLSLRYTDMFHLVYLELSHIVISMFILKGYFQSNISYFALLTVQKLDVTSVMVYFREV